MPLHTDGIAPYASPATILSLLDRARDRGLPTPVTKEVLGRAGVPESLISRTLQALQLLELINSDGTWTENFDILRRSPETEFQSRLAEVVRSVYATIFQYADPAKDSAVAVREAFRSFTPYGQRDRMATLFMALCQKAGISGDQKPKTTQHENRVVKKINTPKPSFKQNPSLGQTRHTHSSELAPPLAGLLATLPANGSGWPQEGRDRFVKAFETILDYCIPIRSREPVEHEEESE
jgi:hypothetical protein